MGMGFRPGEGVNNMNKHDKYVSEMAKTPVVLGVTTSIVANELGARALAKILMDKGIITSDEWRDALQFMTERFVDLHMDGIFEPEYEPDFIDLRADDE